MDSQAAGGPVFFAVGFLFAASVQFTLRCLNQVITSCLNGFY